MYHIVSDVPGVSFEPKFYVGSDAAEHLLDYLQQDLYDKIMPVIENEVAMIFNDAARVNYAAAAHCHIWEKPLDPEGTTGLDHYHFTGTFRFATSNML